MLVHMPPSPPPYPVYHAPPPYQMQLHGVHAPPVPAFPPAYSTPPPPPRQFTDTSSWKDAM